MIAKEWKVEEFNNFPDLEDITSISKRSPVSNLKWDYLYFNDSSVFQVAANKFNEIKNLPENNKEGAYTDLYPGTLEYQNFWKEEYKRCKEGYTVDGIWIPGFYYFYLNYCPIRRVVEDDIMGQTEEEAFPRFLSMDYYFFLEFNDCFNPKDARDRENMILAKSRRMGYSFKMASICVWIYTFLRNTKAIIASESTEKNKRTFKMCKSIIDHLNKYTGFSQPIYKYNESNNCVIISGKEVKSKGKKYVKGLKNEIVTVSLKDKPDAAAGEGASLVIFEEAGMIKHIKKAWEFTEPTLRSGAIKKGVGICFGTGGDMEGATADFCDMFYNPRAYKFRAYKNIYEESVTNDECGYFNSAMWFGEGAIYQDGDKTYEAVDKNGNALFWVVENHLNELRKVAKLADKESYVTSITQNCKTPSEAFLRPSGSVFPVADLMNRLEYLLKKQSNNKPYTEGELIEFNGEVLFAPTEGNPNKPKAITSYPLDTNLKDLRGNVMIYQHPNFLSGETKPPPGAYIIGHDPWGLDATLSKLKKDSSLGAAYVMRTRKYFKSIPHCNEIVATYVGRTDRMDEFNENLLKLAKYYNAKVNFENNRGEVRPYFEKRKALEYLMPSPSAILEKNNFKRSRTSFGYTLTSRRFKEVAIKYVVDWVLESRLDNEERNLDYINDIPLLKEMIAFSFEEGNYDRLMAFVGCVLGQEEEAIYQIDEKPDKKFNFLLNNKLFYENSRF